MTKDDFPTSPDEIDGWIDACGEFTDKFKTLVQTIVYLYKIRDIVSTEQMESLARDIHIPQLLMTDFPSWFSFRELKET